MKIKRLCLENIGPYQGLNDLEFNIDKNKNIVLFGGKNGAGKTTIFKAIKLGLYGSKTYGFDNVNAKYYDEIRNIINNQIKTSNNNKASIRIDIMLDDGKYNNIFSIIRAWHIKGASIKEKCDIYKNDNLISGDEQLNFLAYLNSLISPELFNFFFFDGEKIGDYFLSSDSNHNFRKAFLSLCGLDSISIMIANFERIYKDSSKNSKVSNEYYTIKKDLELLYRQKDLLEKEISSNEMEELSLIDERDGLENIYKNSGGLTFNIWTEINKQLIEEESFRENCYKRLREIALNYLPYVILKDQISNVKKQIEVEEFLNRKLIIRDALIDNKVIEFIANYYTDSKENVQSFTKELCEIIAPQGNNIQSILNLSIDEEKRIFSIIEAKNIFDVKEIELLNNDIKKSLNKTQKARKKLNNSSLDKIDEHVAVISELNKKIFNIKSMHEKMTNQLLLLKQEIENKEKLFDKTQKEFEQELKNQSINNIAGKALFAYKEIEQELIDDYAKKLEIKFIDNFRRIINKGNFIDGISVDNRLNVRPYKYIHISNSEFKQLLNNYGEEYFINTLGVVNTNYIEEAKSKNTKQINLPVLISSPFSQGEKQVYIMALYISLLQIANINVPFVIDTPFARIDSVHRSNIIDVFFKQLDSQIFILSTDEEVMGGLLKQIKKNISNTYLLQSASYGSSSIIKNKYFGDNL